MLEGSCGGRTGAYTINGRFAMSYGAAQAQTRCMVHQQTLGFVRVQGSSSAHTQVLIGCRRLAMHQSSTLPVHKFMTLYSQM